MQALNRVAANIRPFICVVTIRLACPLVALLALQARAMPVMAMTAYYVGAQPPYVSLARRNISVVCAYAKPSIALLLRSCGWSFDADQALVMNLLVASSDAFSDAGR